MPYALHNLKRAPMARRNLKRPAKKVKKVAAKKASKTKAKKIVLKSLFPAKLLTGLAPVKKARIKMLEKRIARLEAMPASTARTRRIRTLSTRLQNLNEKLAERQALRQAKAEIKAGRAVPPATRTVITRMLATKSIPLTRPEAPSVEEVDSAVAILEEGLDAEVAAASNEESAEGEPLELELTEEYGEDFEGEGVPMWMVGAGVLGGLGLLWFLSGR